MKYLRYRMYTLEEVAHILFRVIKEGGLVAADDDLTDHCSEVHSINVTAVTFDELQVTLTPKRGKGWDVEISLEGVHEIGQRRKTKYPQ